MVDLIAFIVVLGVLITAHEFGHFIVGKLAGVKVEVFSIGFGKALVSIRRGGTEYRIARLPFGGYVRFKGMDPLSDEPQTADTGDGLYDQSPFVRILISFAGPAMNLLLPFLILIPLSFGSSHDEVLGNIVGAVDGGLPASVAGLQAGDEIVAIDGEPIDAFWQISDTIGGYDPSRGAMVFTVLREGERVDIAITPDTVGRTDRQGFSSTNYRIGYQPAYLAADVAITNNQGDYARAGGRSFDRILKINGVDVEYYEQAMRTLARLPEDQPATLLIEREVPLGVTNMPFLVGHKTLKLTYRRTAQGPDLYHATQCVSSARPDHPLRAGDCIISIDGVGHTMQDYMLQRLTHDPEKTKAIKVIRDGQIIALDLNLDKVTVTDRYAGELTAWRTGFALFGRRDGLTPLMTQNLHRWAYGWYDARRQVVGAITQTLKSIGGMFTGQVSPRTLGGPIRIFYMAGEFARAGIETFLRFMVLLSLSIALINLMPVPGLDGGHIFIAAVEIVMRRPLSLKAQERLQWVGGMMIFLLIIFALSNDIIWRFTGS